MKQLLDYDPINGVSCYFNSDGETFRFSYEQDPRITLDIIEANKELQTRDGYTKRGIQKDFWHYARIPAKIEYEWMYKHGVFLDNKDHHEKVWELINSREYRDAVKVTEKKHNTRY